jgi:hypothetical protein
LKTVAKELIALINFDWAQGFQKGGTLKTALDIPQINREGPTRFYRSSFKFNFQGLDTDKRFERYAIQCGYEHLAQIHFRIDTVFSVERIQEAFLESLDQSYDVWLREVDVRNWNSSQYKNSF